MPMIGFEPTTYCLRNNCSTTELHRQFLNFNIKLSLVLNALMSKIDPELKKKLLRETKAPFKGLRRVIWVACSGSALLGLFIMITQIIGGNDVQQNNLLIQIGASVLFPLLFFLERDKD